MGWLQCNQCNQRLQSSYRPSTDVAGSFSSRLDLYKPIALFSKSTHSTLHSNLYRALHLFNWFQLLLVWVRRRAPCLYLISIGLSGHTNSRPPTSAVGDRQVDNVQAGKHVFDVFSVPSDRPHANEQGMPVRTARMANTTVKVVATNNYVFNTNTHTHTHLPS